MFLAFQPHLYERDRKVEREHNKGLNKSPPSSLSSSSQQQLQSPSTVSSFPTSISQSSSSIDSCRLLNDNVVSPPTITTAATPPSSLFSRKKFKKRSKTAGDRPSNSIDQSRLSSRSSNSIGRPGSMTREISADAVTFSTWSSSNLNGLSQRDISRSTSGLSVEGKRSSRNLSPEDTRSFKSKDSSAKSGASSSSHFAQSPTSETISSSSLSSSRLAMLDGLGINHLIDSFPLPEEEEIGNDIEDLPHYPLPIRLGLLRPGQLNKAARKRLFRTDKTFPTVDPPVKPLRRSKPVQYCQGYYLCTPPPLLKEERRSMTSPILLISDASTNTVSMATSTRRDVSQKYSAPNPRNRSNSDAETHEMSNSFSSFSKGQNSSQLHQQWKLEQYFRSYSKKTCLGIRHSKFHAYDPEEACYWWGYNAKEILAETLYHSIILTTSGLTLANWSKGPPKRVLDIGTGAGAWVVDCAKKWQETEFIGLDLVPVQTSLDHVQDDDLKSRISWIVANALHGLPFPDNSFDYVHIRLINKGIPEDNWGSLISEAIRVLIPDGNIEILEADWTFFGSPKEVLTSDLQDSFEGKGDNNLKMKMWRKKNSKKYDNLEKAILQIFKTRLIELDPASIIPFHLMSLEVTDLSQGRGRRIPILARSSVYQPPPASDQTKDGEEEEKEITESTQEPNLQQKQWEPQKPSNISTFAVRPQLGQSLPTLKSNLKFNNMDAVRMALLVGDVTHTSECRDLIWEDVEKNRKKDSIKFEKTFINPWKNKGEFEKEMDEWQADMMNRAGFESLLKTTFDWNEAASRMDSRRRKDLIKRKLLPADSEYVLEPYDDDNDDDDNDDQDIAHGEDYGGDEDEDKRTIRDRTPTPQNFSSTTSILAFRTATAFAAKKKS